MEAPEADMYGYQQKSYMGSPSTMARFALNESAVLH